MVYIVPNATEVDQILVQTSTAVPILWPAILAFIFLVIGIGSYMAQERRLSKGNLPSSLTIAGLITTVLGFILFLIEGLVDLNTIVISFIITVCCAIWTWISNME